jgi:hypothetical protein
VRPDAILPELTDKLLAVNYVECIPVASGGTINSVLVEDEEDENEQPTTVFDDSLSASLRKTYLERLDEE